MSAQGTAALDQGGTAIVILMAGESRRMGHPKALAPLWGRPLLAFALDAAHGCAPDKIVLVLGADRSAVLASVDTGSAEIVVNFNYQQGMATSLASGMRSLGPGITRAVVLLGDQPNVTTDLISRLLDLQRGSGRLAAAMVCDGVIMPPAVISGELIEVASRAKGDVGLRTMLRSRPGLVALLEADTTAVMDVDTPDDLIAAERSHESGDAALGLPQPWK